ncbi:NUDIX hydrolase [Jeotgalibacillus terrae]|uniref:NUDIX hydrolase n=1 Tax=Jeotgalibacillus terrae TaxID=587735 RepID=A0ABW5ZGW0_9BACL|nr:NUDIX hydrolase [Jeotgalibacillus terrae]MBM7579401.1 ADP-ribose pyrophosphatase YjhB (NUDIX family) [Jeotgalibacillus terrae]
MNNSWHRAFGVYGLYIYNDKLLVIRKSRGPYRNRYDLPGGSLEEGEGLTEALQREFAEETGLKVIRKNQIGTADFKLPWSWKQHTHVHHIAVFYEVERVEGALAAPIQFDGQDALGTSWISEEEVAQDQASPLVIEAFNWIKNKQCSAEPVVYKEWRVVEQSEEAPWNQNG